MIKELCNEIIYNDFINKTKLTNDEIKILNNLLKKNSIVKISQELNMSDRTVSRIIKDIKEKYTNYKTIELAKINILKS
jgi:DNA-binding MarR family transcriptional regulator